MATKSSLATSDVQAAKGNYTVGRSGQKICKITIHHAVMAKCSARAIANVFVNPNRNASANYCIGYTRGDICCSLYEENRAWTSSSGENDRQAITLEVANSSTKYPYPVSDDTLANIIDLCVDICKRYNFRLTWTGDKNGSLTVHRMFAATACPGEYLMGKMAYIADEVNKRLDAATESTPAPTPTPAPSNEYEIYTVKRGDCLSLIGQRLGVNWRDIASLNGISHPYTIYVNQKLKIKKNGPTPQPAPAPVTINIGDTVIVNGVGRSTATGKGASTRSYSNTYAKVIYTRPGSSHPYALNCNNNMNGVTGWFTANSVRKA